MSSLTEQERLGLEEVFLSISTNRKPHKKFLTLKRSLRAFTELKRIGNHFSKPSTALLSAKKQLKKANLFFLIPKKSKKKKNLS